MSVEHEGVLKLCKRFPSTHIQIKVIASQEFLLFSQMRNDIKDSQTKIRLSTTVDTINNSLRYAAILYYFRIKAVITGCSYI